MLFTVLLLFLSSNRIEIVMTHDRTPQGRLELPWQPTRQYHQNCVILKPVPLFPIPCTAISIEDAGAVLAFVSSRHGNSGITTRKHNLALQSVSGALHYGIILLNYWPIRPIGGS